MTIKTIAICHKMLILLFQQPPDFLKSFPKLPTFCARNWLFILLCRKPCSYILDMVQKCSSRNMYPHILQKMGLQISQYFLLVCTASRKEWLTENFATKYILIFFKHSFNDSVLFLRCPWQSRKSIKDHGFCRRFRVRSHNIKDTPWIHANHGEKSSECPEKSRQQF